MKNLARILRKVADRIDPQPETPSYLWFVPEATGMANVTDIRWTITK